MAEPPKFNLGKSSPPSFNLGTTQQKSAPIVIPKSIKNHVEANFDIKFKIKENDSVEFTRGLVYGIFYSVLKLENLKYHYSLDGPKIDTSLYIKREADEIVEKIREFLDKLSKDDPVRIWVETYLG